MPEFHHPLREIGRGEIKRIEYLKSLLASEKKLMAVVKTELLEVKEKYGDPRRTEIVAAEAGLDLPNGR